MVSACKIQEFQNTELCMEEIVRFFRVSAKRQRFLEKAVDVTFPKMTGKKLKNACRTRWIQRIDAHVVFLELLPIMHIVFQAIISPRQFECLGAADWSWDKERLLKIMTFDISWSLLPFYSALKSYYTFCLASED